MPISTCYQDVEDLQISSIARFPARSPNREAIIVSINKLLSPTNGKNSYIIGAEWGQGRTAFGGATAAVMCHLVMQRASPERNMISFSVTFCAPVTVESEIEIEVEALRRGKTLEQYSVRAKQDGELRAHAVAVFAGTVNSAIKIAAETAPLRPNDIAIPEQRLAVGLNPRFEANFDYRFYKGAPLYSGSTDREHLVGISFKKPPSSRRLAHLVCLMDACPPTPAQQLSEYHPLSTVVWNMHFLPCAKTFDVAQGIIMSSYGEVGIDGAHYLNERVWSHAGLPLAFSTQSVMIFG